MEEFSVYVNPIIEIRIEKDAGLSLFYCCRLFIKKWLKYCDKRVIDNLLHDAGGLSRFVEI